MKCVFKLGKILLLLFLTVGLFSCERWDKNDEEGTKVENIEVDRTVLIYMAANNNLDDNAKSNLDTLKSGFVPNYFEPGGIGGVLLVYYHNPQDRLLDETERPPRLLRISRDKSGKVNEEIIREYDKEQNSGNVSTLKEVLEDATRIFPAEDNGLFLWSHGTGWLPERFYSNPWRSSIGRGGKLRQIRLPQVVDPAAHLVKSFGSDGGKEMDIKELAACLPIKYSFIVFDACLMGGIEVAYELKDKADYIISSSAEILASGFPYDKLMTHIYENEESNLVRVCDEFVDFYNTQTSQLSRSATISLVETSMLNELAIASAVIFNKDRENIDNINTRNIQRYFRYNKNWFYDLDDYMEKISSEPSDYNRFSAAMKSAVIYKKSTPHFFYTGNSYYGDGFPIEHFSGLSTYIPNPNNRYLEDYYKTLSWNMDAQMIK